MDGRSVKAPAYGLLGQDPREPEMREDAGVESRQRGDPTALERDHHQAGRAEHASGGVAGVESERGLPVRSRLDETAAAWTSGDDRVETPGLLATDECERERRHAEAYVVGEQSHDAVHVVRFERGRKPVHELAFGR